MALAQEREAETALDAALAAARARYVERRPKSRALHEAACEHLPGGNTRSVLYFAPFPFRVVRGWDAWLEDADGHQLVDLLGEFTAGLMGHSDPQVRAAIETTLAEGLSFGAHNKHELELARLVCARFPSIERVRFTNSGTEANLMAVSAARVFSGRSRLLVFEGAYHGGLLSFAHGASPVNAPYEVVQARYNDVEGTRRLIEDQGDALAAVLVEPMIGAGGCIPGEPAFHAMLREATRESGALLIYDEVMTSRLAPGGLQERLGITPDLTSLGKYLGGGLSFGAFGGRAEIMALFDPSRPEALPHAGTFNNNVLSMAAGTAALGSVFTPEAATRLNDKGERLREDLNRIFRDAQAPFQATGVGSLMMIHPTRAPITRPEDAEAGDDRLKELLFFELLEEGYYLARRGFIALSLAVTDEQLEGFRAALGRILERHVAIMRQA